MYIICYDHISNTSGDLRPQKNEDVPKIAGMTHRWCQKLEKIFSKNLTNSYNLIVILIKFLNIKIMANYKYAVKRFVIKLIINILKKCVM